MSNVATREARAAESERTEMGIGEERSCCAGGFEDGRGSVKECSQPGDVGKVKEMTSCLEIPERIQAGRSLNFSPETLTLDFLLSKTVKTGNVCLMSLNLWLFVPVAIRQRFVGTKVHLGFP